MDKSFQNILRRSFLGYLRLLALRLQLNLYYVQSSTVMFEVQFAYVICKLDLSTLLIANHITLSFTLSFYHAFCHFHLSKAQEAYAHRKSIRDHVLRKLVEAKKLEPEESGYLSG